MTRTFENLLLDGRPVDLEVADGRIRAIVPVPPEAAARRQAVCAPVVPAFYNCHTHLAMSLLRGCADDLALMPWLQEHIWPAESRLTDEIVYAGARLGMLELIRSGTVFANDMYWHAPMVARAAEEDKLLLKRVQALAVQGCGGVVAVRAAAVAAAQDVQDRMRRGLSVPGQTHHVRSSRLTRPAPREKNASSQP